MTEGVKLEIRRLKDMVRAMTRSAGELDAMIETIERSIEDESQEYSLMVVKSAINYREMWKRVNCFENFDEREKSILNHLLLAMSEKEKES